MSGRRVPVPWIVVGMLALVWGLVVWGAVAEDRSGRVVPGFETVVSDGESPGEMLSAGADWVLERSTYQTDDADGRPAGDVPCVRLRLGDRATTCVAPEYSQGGSSVGVVRAPDGRHFVQFFAHPSVAAVRLFTSARQYESLTPVPTDDAGSGVVTVVELQPEEEPFGIQVFEADGDLISVQSLVGALD